MLVAPVLVMVFAGVEFGRLIWTRNAVQQTAIATARCMGIRQPACATTGTVDLTKTVTFARTRARGYSVGVLASGVVIAASGDCAGQSGFASVTITTVFRTQVPVVGRYLGTTNNVSSNACFPIQQ